MEQNNNKKTLILSLVAVLVLIGSVVGVAYAMFSFSATGTQTNVIKTGYVTINFDSVTTIDLTNALPTADASVSEVTSGTGVINTMSFDVAADINGTMTLKYDIAISDIVQTGSLKEANVKIRLKKSTDSGSNWTYVLGSSDSGVTIGSLSSTAGPKGLISTYGLDGGEFTADGTVKYMLTAWIDSSWTLSSTYKCYVNGTLNTTYTTQATCEAVENGVWTSVDYTVSGACSDTTYTTAAECIAAGKNWIQTKATESQNFSFKVKLSAAQVTSE